MKIAIGINTYKNEKDFNNREQMCVDSIREICKKYDTVEAVSVTYKDESFVLDGFLNVHALERTNVDLAKKKLPFVNDIFDILAHLNYDYFIFINSDVAISDRFIKAINQNPTKECFPATKLHFTKLDSIHDKTSVPQSVSVHGFDGFGIKKEWWVQNKEKFKPMLLSRAYWDTYFFAKCMIYGDCKVLNKPPLSIFHLDHKSSSMETDPGNEYNRDTFASDKDQLGLKWFGYVQNVLLKRPTHNNILWYIPFQNEEELEQQYFKS
jgi:hypothetical protein